MLPTEAGTTRPSARRVAVIAPAESISDMIQPPKISPPGLVSAGIARVRAASSPRGSAAAPAFCSVSGDIAQIPSGCRDASVMSDMGRLYCDAIIKLYQIVKYWYLCGALHKRRADAAR